MRQSGEAPTTTVESEVVNTSTRSPAPQVARTRPAEAAGDGQHRGLGDQQPRQPRTARAERAPERQLALAGGAAGDQQVGDVGAGDQQHAGGDRHQDAQRRGELAAHLGLAVAGVDDLNPRLEELRLGLRRGALEAGLLHLGLEDGAEERLQPRLRPRRGRPGLQPGVDLDPAEAAVARS